ncbi:Hypothetical predicted protein [Cloeon dipterum]|uniref:Uncharacterized protein n=1 Tax=Cloeon dipterum TaxID=197152 RepID=A0A8S1C6U5_9INSE|nr:Hypothetical predicted protein [Cloeon dipterum]
MSVLEKDNLQLRIHFLEKRTLKLGNADGTEMKLLELWRTPSLRRVSCEWSDKLTPALAEHLVARCLLERPPGGTSQEPIRLIRDSLVEAPPLSASRRDSTRPAVACANRRREAATSCRKLATTSLGHSRILRASTCLPESLGVEDEVRRGGLNSISESPASAAC